MWRVFHYWALLGEHSLLCPLLDCIQIGPNNDAGLTWLGLFLCAMRAPSPQYTTATDHWPPPSGICCSEEVSKCLMTLASRNKVGSKPFCTPPPYDAYSPACCWTVLWGSWRLLLPQYPLIGTGLILFFPNATTIWLVSEVSSWRRLWLLLSTKPSVVLLHPPSLPPTIRPTTGKSSENFWWK